jgi:hypothetical protein
VRDEDREHRSHDDEDGIPQPQIDPAVVDDQHTDKRDRRGDNTTDDDRTGCDAY